MSTSEGAANSEQGEESDGGGSDVGKTAPLSCVDEQGETTVSVVEVMFSVPGVASNGPTELGAIPRLTVGVHGDELVLAREAGEVEGLSLGSGQRLYLHKDVGTGAHCPVRLPSGNWLVSSDLGLSEVNAAGVTPLAGLPPAGATCPALVSDSGAFVYVDHNNTLRRAGLGETWAISGNLGGFRPSPVALQRGDGPVVVILWKGAGGVGVYEAEKGAPINADLEVGGSPEGEFLALAYKVAIPVRLGASFRAGFVSSTTAGDWSSAGSVVPLRAGDESAPFMVSSEVAELYAASSGAGLQPLQFGGPSIEPLPSALDVPLKGDVGPGWQLLEGNRLLFYSAADGSLLITDLDNPDTPTAKVNVPGDPKLDAAMVVVPERDIVVLSSWNGVRVLRVPCLGEPSRKDLWVNPRGSTTNPGFRYSP